MYKKMVYVILILSTFFKISVGQEELKSELLILAELQEDYDYMLKTLEETHSISKARPTHGNDIIPKSKISEYRVLVEKMIMENNIEGVSVFLFSLSQKHSLQREFY